MISDRVPDRARCEALKAAGMPQETEFCWYFSCSWYKADRVPADGEIETWELERTYLVRARIGDDRWCKEAFAAPLVTEIWEWLPTDVTVDGENLDIRITKCGGVHYAGYYYFDSGPYVEQQDNGLSNALADLLLWAIKEGYVKW